LNRFDVIDPTLIQIIKHIWTETSVESVRHTRENGVDT